MASPLEWALKIVDRASGPAKAAATAMKQFASAAKAADAATSKPLKVNISSRVKDEIGKAKSDMKGFGSDLADSFGGLETLAAGAVAAVYAGVGLLAAKGAKMAIDAVTFRENTTVAFKALLGSQAAAAGLYEKVLDVADKVGLEKEQAVASVKKLLSAGFDQAGAIQVLEALANTGAVLGEQAAGKLEKFFLTLQSTGKADIGSLAKTGINVANVYERLGKQLGITAKQAEAMAKAGRIGAADMVKAVSDEVNKGDIGQQLGNNLDRIFGDISGKIARLFDKVNLGPLKDAAKSVLAALEGPAGEKLRAGINKIFGGIFDALFGGLTSGRIDAVIKGIADALNVIGDIVVAVAPAAKAFFGALIDGAVFVWPIFAAIGGAIAAVVKKLNEWGVLGVVMKGIAYIIVFLATAFGLAAVAASLLFVPLYALIGVVGALVYGFVSLIGWLIDNFRSLPGMILGALSAAGSWLYEAGASMIMGLAQGIIANGSAVIDAIVGVAKSAIAAAKSAIGYGSPATEFMPLGASMTQGVGVGVATDNTADRAVESMVAPPQGLSAEQAGASTSGGSGINVGGIHIEVHTGSGDAQEIAAVVLEKFEEQWDAMLASVS